MLFQEFGSRSICSSTGQGDGDMSTILDMFSAKRRLRERADWALHGAPRFGESLIPPTEAEAARRSAIRPLGRAPAAPDHLYFNVRSFAAGEGAHTLQFGFVDRNANVVLSVFAKAPSPIGWSSPADAPLPVAPLEPDALERLLTPLCRGVTLVGFHRMLQGGLLPRAAADSAVSLHCVWRRLQEAAKTHRLCARRDRPMTLNEGLALAGLPPLASDDAAMRALAVRDLWLWLDSLG
jgi:hypothetical protein